MTRCPRAEASALNEAGPSPQPRMRPPRSVADSAHMLQYWAEVLPQGTAEVHGRTGSCLFKPSVGSGRWGGRVHYQGNEATKDSLRRGPPAAGAAPLGPPTDQLWPNGSRSWA